MSSSTALNRLLMLWWVDYFQDFLKPVLGLVLMNSTELTSRYCLLSLNSSRPSDKQCSVMIRTSSLKSNTFRLSLLAVCLSLWILDTLEELSYPIILRSYSGQYQWWYLTTVWLQKLCFSLRGLWMHAHSHLRWSSSISFHQSSYPSKTITTSVWEL